jgi:hypothetical protein
MTAAPTNHWLTDALTLAIDLPDLTPRMPSGRTAPVCRPPPPPVGLPLPPPPNAASRGEDSPQETAMLDLYRDRYQKMLARTGAVHNRATPPAEPRGPEGRAPLAEPAAKATGEAPPAGQKGRDGRSRPAEPTPEAASEVPQCETPSLAEQEGGLDTPVRPKDAVCPSFGSANTQSYQPKWLE